MDEMTWRNGVAAALRGLHQLFEPQSQVIGVQSIHSLTNQLLYANDILHWHLGPLLGTIQS